MLPDVYTNMSLASGCVADATGAIVSLQVDIVI